MTSVRRTATALLAVLLVCAGCGGGGTSTDKHLGAAEPATAPATSAKPAGKVFKVGDLPQGIVYDAKTRLVAVAVHNPYRLLLLDPDTLKTRRSVPLPGKARHLQVAKPGGPVLVPAETADELVEVSLPGGQTRTTKVLRHPHDATGTPKGDIIVGDEFSGAFTVVRDGKVIKNDRDLQQPGGVHVTGNILAVVDVGTFTVSTYDLRTFKRTGRLAAGAGPTHGVLAGGGRFAVADTRGGHLIVYDLDPLKRLGSIDLPGSPYGMVADETTGTVWVTLTAKNKLVGYDVSSGTPRKVAEYDTVRQPDTVAVAPGSHTLWVTGTDDGVVQRITR